ncbi:flippase [Aliarcobacter cryaerophilus]|uniref:flippase n=1 Tax=Aliarcobacter cryaerophilus TaxID=28198 RepID=UPI003BAF4B3E
MYKKLISDSAIYGLGAIVVKSIAFFTLPIYTRIFSPEEFGIIEMFVTISGILSILMTLGLDSTQSYYFMEAKNKSTYDIKKVTTSILQLRITLGVILIGLVSLLAPFILDFAFDTKLPVLYLIMIAFATFFANLVSQSLEIFRLIYKPWQYIGLSFVQTVLNIGFILYFTYIKDMGLEGYFLGNMIAMFISLFIGWIATRDYRYWKNIEVELWKPFLKFGLPLVPAGLMVWIMNASDRWFVMNMLGAYETGLYAVAAKFAMLMALVVETFRSAWWPIAMDMLHKEDGAKFFRVVSLWYIVFTTIGAIIITIISPYLVEYLTTETYKESWKIVGILCWGSIFYGFYLLSGLGIFYSKKTHLTIYVYGSGAVLNIVLNYILIPIFGLLGAALGTVISLLFANIISMIVSNKFYKIDWHWFYMGISILIGILFILKYIGEL